ncbi:homoserine kinase [Metaclostridioides mangenotii]|uniref:homoserine kinase n=1 Tax=Metaclostridioides mangenotii TaxID=1540 RepID=UPI000464BC22|nr:homoserine kinase [Clostridioides mangenotii]
MIEIIVPATTANVGPGFDCLGIALNLYNKFYFEEIDKGLIIEGCDYKYKNENNLVYSSMKYFFDNVKPAKVPNGVKIIIEDNIPICRGLGSSATCIVAGVMAADALSGSNLSKDELLKIACEIEGHPDNVAPAIFGNMMVCISDGDELHYDVVIVPQELKFCAFIPEFKLSTEQARNVLPTEVSHVDAVFNVGRVSMLISALLNKNFELLKIACQDKLHQKYRGTLIKGYDSIIDYANDIGALGVFISGSGSTIMSLILEDKNFKNNMNSYLSKSDSKWDVKDLSCDLNGAVVNYI